MTIFEFLVILKGRRLFALLFLAQFVHQPTNCHWEMRSKVPDHYERFFIEFFQFFGNSLDIHKIIYDKIFSSRIFFCEPKNDSNSFMITKLKSIM